VNRTFAYDAVGNRLSETVQAIGNKTTTTNTAYSYDGANRLLSVVSPQSSVVSLAYDANGNRVSSSSSGLIEQYGYNFEDQLTSYTRLIPQSNGKYKTDMTAAYAYDGMNMLMAAIEKLINRKIEHREVAILLG